MSVKPDRQQLMWMCDKLEADDRESFDPEQVAHLRSWIFERCQPKVKDVVEMAMRYRESDIGGFENIFDRNGRAVEPLSGSYLVLIARDAESPEDALGSKLASKLLEMTPQRRRDVATRVEEKVRQRRRADANPYQGVRSVTVGGVSAPIVPGSFEMTPSAPDLPLSPGTSRQVTLTVTTPLIDRFRELALEMREGQQAAFETAIRTCPRRAIYTVTGETLAVIQEGFDEDGPYAVTVRSDGVRRRFDGDQYLQLRFPAP